MGFSELKRKGEYLFSLTVEADRTRYAIADAIDATSRAVHPSLCLKDGPSSFVPIIMTSKRHKEKLLQAIERREIVPRSPLTGDIPEHPVNSYPAAVSDQWLLSLSEFRKFSDSLLIELLSAEVSPEVQAETVTQSESAKALPVAASSSVEGAGGSSAQVTPAAPANAGPVVVSKGDEVSTAIARRRAPPWRELAWPYIVAKLGAGKYSTAKELDRALIACAAEPESPFDVGTGPTNKGLLVLRKTGKKLELKTIQNNWGKLRGDAELE
jgi:hypothetical protein